MQDLKLLFVYWSGDKEIDLKAIEEEILHKQVRLEVWKWKAAINTRC